MPKLEKSVTSHTSEPRKTNRRSGKTSILIWNLQTRFDSFIKMLSVHAWNPTAPMLRFTTINRHHILCSKRICPQATFIQSSFKPCPNRCFAHLNWHMIIALVHKCFKNVHCALSHHSLLVIGWVLCGIGFVTSLSLFHSICFDSLQFFYGVCQDEEYLSKPYSAMPVMS